MVKCGLLLCEEDRWYYFVRKFMTIWSLWYGGPLYMNTKSPSGNQSLSYGKNQISRNFLYCSWIIISCTIYSHPVILGDSTALNITEFECFTVCRIHWSWNSLSFVWRMYWPKKNMNPSENITWNEGKTKKIYIVLLIFLYLS